MGMLHRKSPEMSWLEWIDRNFVLILGQLAGLIMLIAGTASVVLFGWVATKIWSRGHIDAFGLGLLAVLGVVGCFGLVVGYRMLFLKPSRSGSILGAPGWIAMGLFWGAIALLLLVVESSFANAHLAVASGAACIWSFYKAKRSTKLAA
jgi:hypothetical protein